MSLRHFVGVCLVVVLGHAAMAMAQTAAPPTATPATEAFSRAVQLHDAGKFTDAAAEFERAATLGFQPVNMARFRVIRALVRAADHEKALTLLEQLAAAGFVNVGALTSTDLDAVRSMSRFQAASAHVTRNANPCGADANFRAFDFWIGEWDVQNTATPRAPMGQGATSVITRSLNGCAIEEHWMPAGGGAGKSLNTYNTVTRQWEQYYVDARGTITHYTGTFREGTLYFEASQFASTNKIRMTFFNQGPTQVRQLGHVSSDGGKTWTVSFDLTYVRKPATQKS